MTAASPPEEMAEEAEGSYDPIRLPAPEPVAGCEQEGGDETDVGQYPPEELGQAEYPRARRRQAERRQKKKDSSPSNDAFRGHGPQHVEKDIGDLGELMSLMQPQELAQEHEFAATLAEYAASGVPVDCGAEWSPATIQLAIEKGPHQSAAVPEAWELFEEDVKYQVEAGFSRIVEWDAIKDALPRKLKISPVALVPQANRRPRIILDLSFPVRLGREIVQQAVNDSTEPLADPRAIDQIGKVMPRTLEFMANAPREHPIYFSKYDISDGFWRMVVARGEEWNFAYVLPQPPGAPVRLVVPNALQMGWKESPGYFCSASETARDIAADLAGFNGVQRELPMHRLEELIQLPPPEQGSRPDVTPWSAIEVYVDDFILMSQEDRSGLQRLTRATLHGIESIFPPISVTQHQNGREPISEKKVNKGEAHWLVEKEVLGWLLQGANRTIELPEKKAQAIVDELRKLLRKRKVGLNRLQKIVGKLRHAALAIPAGKALFTAINMAMRGSPKVIGLGKQSEVHTWLGDFLRFIKELGSRPTHVNEIVSTKVDYYGYCDACGTGVGGVWLPAPNSDLAPFIWRVQWPPDIVRRMERLQGISISDLECAGVVLQQLALEHVVSDLRHKQAAAFCDNTPAVSWVTKLASKQSVVGGRLVRGMAYRARLREMCLTMAESIAGDDNPMADVASRSFSAASKYDFSDNQLLTHFEAHFPLPQNHSWKLVTLPPEDISQVISILRGERLTLASWTPSAAAKRGATGARSSPNGTEALTSSTARKPSKLTSSLPLLSGSGKASTAEGARSLRSRWEKLSQPSARPSKWRDTTTPPRSMAAESASFHSAGSSKHTPEQTQHQGRS